MLSEAEPLPIARPLRQRLITAGVLAPVFALAVLYLPTSYFAAVLGGVVFLAALEWCGLAGLRPARWRWAYAGLVIACLLLSWSTRSAAWHPFLFAIASVWWVGVALVLSRVDHVRRSAGIDTWLLPVGLLVLLPPWIAMVRLHDYGDLGPRLVMALLMLIWIADSAAFFSGSRWGRCKLAPALSPGKTWAGLYGALIGAFLWGLVLVLLLRLSFGKAALLVALCGAAALLSIVGDLFESLLKRRRGLKDTGSILPGHGGVLDRIDSMTAAAPLFALGFHWLERIL